ASVTIFSIALQYAITTEVIGKIVQPISYVFAHGVKETIYTLFWVYAGNLYDAEQSKRLFPFFAGSVLVGKILGGIVGAWIAPIVHAENFIGAQAVGFFVCFVALMLYRGLPEGRGGKVEDKHRPEGLRATIRESVDGYRAVTSALLAGIALQLGERIWIPALHRPATELVYSQVSAAIRPRARAFLSGGVNAVGNMVAAVALIAGLQYSDIRTLLVTGTGLSLVYLYNSAHIIRHILHRHAENLISPDPD